jgi:hypothetical protein
MAAVLIGLCWILAALVYLLGDLVAPAYYAGTIAAPSGINYGQVVALPFARAFGLWTSLMLLGLGPALVGWIALQRGMDQLLRKALGTGSSD